PGVPAGGPTCTATGRAIGACATAAAAGIAARPAAPAPAPFRRVLRLMRACPSLATCSLLLDGHGRGSVGAVATISVCVQQDILHVLLGGSMARAYPIPGPGVPGPGDGRAPTRLALTSAEGTGLRQVVLERVGDGLGATGHAGLLEHRRGVVVARWPAAAEFLRDCLWARALGEELEH